jgi:hypothetical protein
MMDASRSFRKPPNFKLVTELKSRFKIFFPRQQLCFVVGMIVGVDKPGHVVLPGKSQLQPIQCW